MFLTSRKTALVLVPLLVLGGMGPAAAQSARVLGDFRDWSSYAADDGSGTICFAMTKPKSSDPAAEVTGEAYVYITDRPAEDVASEFNVVAGYTFQTGSFARVSVSGRISRSSPRATPPGSTIPPSRRRWPPPSAAARP